MNNHLINCEIFNAEEKDSLKIYRFLRKTKKREPFILISAMKKDLEKVKELKLNGLETISIEMPFEEREEYLIRFHRKEAVEVVKTLEENCKCLIITAKESIKDPLRFYCVYYALVLSMQNSNSIRFSGELSPAEEREFATVRRRDCLSNAEIIYSLVKRVLLCEGVKIDLNFEETRRLLLEEKKEFTEESNLLKFKLKGLDGAYIKTDGKVFVIPEGSTLKYPAERSLKRKINWLENNGFLERKEEFSTLPGLNGSSLKNMSFFVVKKDIYENSMTECLSRINSKNPNRSAHEYFEDPEGIKKIMSKR